MSIFSRKKPQQSEYSRLICLAADKMGVKRASDGMSFEEFAVLLNVIVDRIIILESKAHSK